jgi:hypothetical protein
MSEMPQPKLSPVPEAAPQPGNPPRKRGKHGAALWSPWVAEYDLSDAAGREMLAPA